MFKSFEKQGRLRLVFSWGFSFVTNRNSAILKPLDWPWQRRGKKRTHVIGRKTKREKEKVQREWKKDIAWKEEEEVRDDDDDNNNYYETVSSSLIKIIGGDAQLGIREFGHIRVMSMAEEVTWFFDETPTHIPPHPNRED